MAITVFIFTFAISISALGDTANIFDDIPQNVSYLDAVESLVQLGIFSGDENGKFNPNKTVTRAEAATIICNMLGVSGDAGNKISFADVPSNHWATKYISKASELGIISGYGNNEFKPNNPVTYEQMVTMLINAWGYSDLAREAGGYPEGYIKVAEELGVQTIHNNNLEEISRYKVAILVFKMLQCSQFVEE